MRLTHVLLDADGVLQEVAAGWQTVVDDLLGEHGPAFVAGLAEVEEPALAGADGFPDPDLGRLLRTAGSSIDPEVLYDALWLRLDVSAPTLAIVAELRASGLGVHLATNQHRRRAAYMKGVLGYDDRFDHGFYSCDLGVAKPDPAYFRSILDVLDASADEVAFVDDSAVNVAGAREVGLRAVRWELAEGHDVLRSRLAHHGAMLAR